MSHVTCTVCDDCNTLHHGDCPVHGPLKELDLSAGIDLASLTFTQLPVPAQLTVKRSCIAGAGLGVFAKSYIPRGIRVGPYEGKRVDKQDMGDISDTAYAWEVSGQNGIQNIKLALFPHILVCMATDKSVGLYPYLTLSQTTK